MAPGGHAGKRPEHVTQADVGGAAHDDVRCTESGLVGMAIWNSHALQASRFGRSDAMRRIFDGYSPLRG